MMKIVDKIIRNVKDAGKPEVVHCEAIYLDRVYKRVLKYCKINKTKFFVMTPVNSKLFWYAFHVDKKTVLKKMALRYRALEKTGQEIQLHVHVYHPLVKVSYNYEKKMITGAYYWCIRNGFKPTEYVGGSFGQGKNTVKICKELGMKVAPRSKYRFIHDYDIS